MQDPLHSAAVYQSLLTKRYLTSKIMPLLAASAVMLCTAMVLIVWSVMGGFLNKLLDSGRTMVGDVFIEWPSSGFAYYDELITDLEKDPQVAAATPMIETFGVVSLSDDRVEGVTIRAIDPKSFSRVVDYPSMLWWKPIETPLPKDKLSEDPRLDAKRKQLMADVYNDGLKLAEVPGKDMPEVQAAVIGIEMSGFSKRQDGGFYEPRALVRPRADGQKEVVSRWMPNSQITIRVLPLDRGGRDIQLASASVPVANEFRTGIYENDRRSMFVPLALGQRLLKMDAAQATAPGFNPYDFQGDAGKPGLSTPVVTGEDPARVTTVLIKAKEGTTADQLRVVADAVYEKFAARHPGKVPSIMSMRESDLIKTWEMRQATFIGAVKKETSLVLLILCFISLTASFLILAIFWAMISEKTKDIGILRSLGASRAGIAWIWLRYGIAIGVAGSISGFGLAYLIVTNINSIHEWMGTALGLYIWDPRVYYFTEIPSRVETSKAVVVLTGGVLFSLFGALIPAIRAASLDPVRALRFE